MVQKHKLIPILPTFVKRMIVGKKVTIDGQTLNLNSQLTLKNFYSMIDDKICNHSPEGARAMLNKIVDSAYSEKEISDLCDTQDQLLKCNDVTVPIRIYRPKNNDNKIPTLVYLHGGGFVIGTLKMYDYLCAQYSSTCNIQVISVDYRLAPENKFPIPVTDCLAAYNKLYDLADNFNIDIKKMAVGGDSAGGNLSTVVASQLIKIDRTPKFQLLIYPVVKEGETPSYELFKEGFLLERDDMHWFANHYVYKDTDRMDPRLSPLYSDNLKQMPPTIMVIAGFDPLRDGGFEYADKLKKFGVEVTMQIYNDQFHGFYHMANILPEALDAVKATCKSINILFDK